MLDVVGRHVDGETWSMSGFLRECLSGFAESPVVAAAYAAEGKEPPSFNWD
jgi:hypothetical protein